VVVVVVVVVKLLDADARARVERGVELHDAARRPRDRGSQSAAAAQD